jgi:signal transduction histidine kinase
MVRQALTNVIDNAIKFTGQGTAVHVSLRAEPHRVALVVDDQGPGIPEAERGRVVERFYRVDHGADRPGRPGTGLGLAIAHWAVTANGDTLGVEENPAGGARLILWLPALPAQT